MPKTTFIGLEEYKSCRKALEEALEGEDAKARIEAYSAYLKLTDEAFPMLLRCGDPLQLGRPPDSIHLLPPVTGLDGRLLLCQSSNSLHDEPPLLQLIHWSHTGTQSTLSVLTSGEKLLFPKECKLTPCPNRIETLALNSAFIALCLHYPAGKLFLTATSKEGIKSASWTTEGAEKSVMMEKRASGGEMPCLVRIAPSQDTGRWADDQLLDDRYRPIEWKGRNPIGRISGCDGPADASCCYLASDLARIMRVDIGTGQVVESEPLGGRIEDVLLMEVTHGTVETEQLILAPCYDGYIYWLSPETLEVTHWQSCEQLHISTLIGAPDTGRLLALDQYNHLIPLQLQHPEEHRILKSDAVMQITADYTEEQWHDRLKPEDLLEGIPPQSQIHYRLLLERWLLDLNPSPPGNRPTAVESALRNTAEWLLLAYSEKPQDHCLLTLAELHYLLLRRIWNWMANICLKRRTADHTDYERALPLLKMLTILPDEAPDWLWLKLFRESDWLPYWIETIGADDSEPYRKFHAYKNELHGRITERRTLIWPKAHALRGLTIRSSSRLPGQARHIRPLKTPGFQDYFACTVYGKGIWIFQVESGDLHRRITRYKPKGAGPAGWIGLVSTLATGIDNLDNPEEEVVFMATNRGEARLLAFNGQELKAVDKREIPLNCHTARYLAFKGGSRGVLIGGKTPAGEPALVWLRLNRQGRFQGEPATIWRDKEASGSLRMIHEDHSLRYIWGVDKVRGLLLRWPLQPLQSSAGNPRRLSLRPERLLSARTPLSALYVSQQGKRVACSGHNGFIAVVAGEHGQLCWGHSGGTTVRHIRHLAGASEQGSWLLAGDSPHCMLHNEHGRLTGLLEHLGPILSLNRFRAGVHRLLIMGGRSGRLLLLDMEGPERAESLDNAADPSHHSLCYPLSAPANMAASELLKQLSRLSEKHPDICGEALIISSFFKALYNELLDTSRAKATLKLLEKLDPYQLALFLWGLQQALGQKKYRACSALMPLLQKIKTRYCRQAAREQDDIVFNALLHNIETLALEGNSKDKALELIRDMDACLWQTPPPTGKPCKICNLCTQNGRQQRRWLQLNQAMRHWQAALEQDKVNIPLWCNRLAQLWQPQAPAALAGRFTQLLKRLPVKKAQSPWIAFLLDPETAEQLPLARLTAPEHLKPLHAAERDNLIEVWPELPAWRTWVTTLTERLEALHRARNTARYRAWREYEQLQMLEDHLCQGAEQAFTTAHGLCYAALFWCRQQAHWVAAIARQREALEQRVLSAPDNLLAVKPTLKWRDKNHIDLALEVQNNGPRPVTLIALRPPADYRGPVHGWPRKESLSISGNPQQLEGIRLHTPTDDRVDLTLEMACSDYYDRPFSRTIAIKGDRSLAGFTTEPGWLPTASRLKALLDKNRPFYWLCGPRWPRAEHGRLLRLVRDIAPEGQLQKIERLPQALEKPDQPVLVPDLDPEQPPPQLLEQLHALLHQNSEGFRPSRLALALWLHLRSTTPAPIGHAFKQPGLADAPQARQLMANLLDEPRSYTNATEAISALPPQAIAHWCCGDPLLPEGERYRLEPALLGLWFWETLRDARLSTTVITEWLGISQQALEPVLEACQATRQLMARGQRSYATARPLLKQLTGAEPSLLDETPCASARIDLLHRTLERVYLVPPKRERFRRPQKEGLWLSTHAPPPPGLPGESLKLEEDQLLALIGAATTQAAQQRLNQIAATQLQLDPGRVFQTAGGLDEARMARSFHGREDELETLKPLMASSGEGTEQWASALLVGSRRSGKTTLLQKIRREIRQHERPPPVISINFLGMPPFSGKGKEGRLLRWFLHEWQRQLTAEGVPFESTWDDPENQRKQEQAVTAIESQLRILRKRRGRTVLLFDETHKLLAQDRPEHPVFSLLRKLLQDDLIALIATSFPHGAGRSESLRIQNRSQSNENGLYNTFPNQLLLKPWSPQESWAFLEGRLNGFGIHIPKLLRSEMLHLCRGIPWIAQSLGEAICRQQAESHRRGMVQISEWRGVRSEILAQIGSELYTTLTLQVEQISRESRPEWRYQQEQVLVNRLMDAFTTLADQVDFAPEQEEAGWLPDARFDLDGITSALDRETADEEWIHQLLNQLTHTSFFHGDPDHKERFYFSSNLLPMYTQSSRR